MAQGILNEDEYEDAINNFTQKIDTITQEEINLLTNCAEQVKKEAEDEALASV